MHPVSDPAHDDYVLPFAIDALDTRGRLARLGPSIDAILTRHAYPAPVARLLGEAAALTSVLATALKIEGRFQLQTRSDGPVDMIVVDFDFPDRLRAFARYDAKRLAEGRFIEGLRPDLLGSGHLALTVEQGEEHTRYQGIVVLEGQGLEAAAHEYFRQSEQIPTFVRLAVAQAITPSGAQWRAGALLVQFLPDSPERRRIVDMDPGDAPDGVFVPESDEDNAWTEARLLAATVEDHELVDPTLSSERLLFRLFHERGVKVFEAAGVLDRCRCSDGRVRAMLEGFSASDRKDMIGDDGKIGVTCEFCSTKRVYEPSEFGPAD